MPEPMSSTPSPDSPPARDLPAGSHEALRAWLKLLACHNLVESQLRTMLRLQFDTTLPRFDLMAQLQRYPEGLRMRELSQRMMVTGGNVTGLVDRLVEEGLIARVDAPDDRRAYLVSLTAKGRQEFAAMAAEHERWVMSLFGGLEPAELDSLSALLGKLKSHLAQGGVMAPEEGAPPA
ncbi:MarR family winged helix-turn-helix transcriptional regulator [Vogesella sp. LIG4]|uniref:MarR family winged helix-turn-helix transcriptional regulator n=1 Tax=Vogesella sp. LIG4 TaxID=1192162 RepID=UPI00081FC4B3|nr:MarR family transcriptional regulator [Vogesella sp. LIG4]SCK28834.1 transcriptional regulator, MarR family [Vogesella sp. LIG4]